MMRSRTPEYVAWVEMRRRCQSRKNYCDRGITVHPEWQHSFELFLAHVGLRPTKRHSLDRINNNGNYVPGNVRWATPKTQARNTRAVRLISHDGEARSMAEWAEMAGVTQDVLKKRLDTYRWPITKAISLPARHYRRAS